MAYKMRANVYKQGADNPARRYLQEYPAMYEHHAALMRELARLREHTTRATGRMDALRLSGTPNHGGNEDAMLRVVEAEDALTDLIGRLAVALSDRLRLIESLPDELQKTLLTLRYINGLDWEQVGYKLHYERNQVYELHGRALKAAQSCEDQGIRMEVVSASLRNSTADIIVSLRDMAADRLDGTIDLFDSYSINRPFGGSAGCSLLNYDPVARVAFFSIHIEEQNGSSIAGSKITFSIDRLLGQKKRGAGRIDPHCAGSSDRSGHTGGAVVRLGRELRTQPHRCGNRGLPCTRTAGDAV